MLIDADELRTLFDIATQIVADRLTFCIENASRTLKGWVGADAYEAAEAYEPPDPEDPPDPEADPEDADRASALKAAESYLAMYHALLNTGARIRRDGLVNREHDAAGPVGANVVNEYYSPKDLIALRNEYLEQAKSFASGYLEEADQQATLGAHTITMRGGWANPTEEYDL